MKKPIIGILGAHMSNNGGPAPVPADYVNHAYCAGVENAGGIPILLPVLKDPADMDVAFRAKCKIFSRHLQKPILKTEKGRFKGL